MVHHLELWDQTFHSLIVGDDQRVCTFLVVFPTGVTAPTDVERFFSSVRRAAFAREG